MCCCAERASVLRSVTALPDAINGAPELVWMYLSERACVRPFLNIHTMNAHDNDDAPGRQPAGASEETVKTVRKKQTVRLDAPAGVLRVANFLTILWMVGGEFFHRVMDHAEFYQVIRLSGLCKALRDAAKMWLKNRPEPMIRGVALTLAGQLRDLCNAKWNRTLAQMGRASDQSTEALNCRVVETFKTLEDNGKYFPAHSMEVVSPTHTQPLFTIGLHLLPQSADSPSYPMTIQFGVDRELNITDKGRSFRFTPTSPLEGRLEDFQLVVQGGGASQATASGEDTSGYTNGPFTKLQDLRILRFARRDRDGKFYFNS